MDKRVVQQHLMALLRSALTGMEVDSSTQNALTPDTVSALFDLAKRHDVAHMVASAIRQCHIDLPDELAQTLRREVKLSIFRSEQTRHVYEQICAVFEKNTIPYIPLKGMVIRGFYPEEYMRTSCDIDLLIKPEDLPTATEALTALGYKKEKDNFHDISFYSPSNIHLELHFNLLENMDAIDPLLNRVWEYAVSTDTCVCRLTDAFFLFHFFAHLSYHFQSGGCGLRSLVDLWVLKFRADWDYTLAQPLLKEAGIESFAAEMTRLSEDCFGENPLDGFEENLLDYIIHGDIYGNVQSRIAANMTQSNSTGGYLRKRLFPPRESMLILYPILEKMPLLLPFCWMTRLCQTLFGKRRKRAMQELKTANRLSGAQLDRIRHLHTQLGL